MTDIYSIQGKFEENNTLKAMKQTKINNFFIDWFPNPNNFNGF